MLRPNYSAMLIPETYAPYSENKDKELPWCSIYHTCPSNIIWIKFDGEDKWHLVQKVWVPQDGPRLPGDDMRSDGMVWNRTRDTMHCNRDIPSHITVVQSTIGLYKHDACPECWDKRW